MQWTNTERGYGWIAIALHWFAVIAIALMLTTGFRVEHLADLGDRAGRDEAMRWHVGFGVTFLLLFLARVMSSYLQKKPAPIEQPRPLMWIASATHQLLLAAILIQIISGPLAVWSGGNPINVFGLFAIPTPFPERNQSVHEVAEVLHAVGPLILFLAGSLHILAVIKHAFERRGVLQRMLAPPA